MTKTESRCYGKMKVKVDRKLTAAQKKVIRDEMRRQSPDVNAEFLADLEVMVAWTLHVHYGFGIGRLLKFRRHFIDEYNRLCKHYEMDEVYPAKCKLKDIGYDIDKLMEEDSKHES